MQNLIVVDISSFIFRAFYAIRPLTSPQGIPVNAVYGVYTMILKLLSDYKPTHFVIAGDRKEKTFRHEMYENYKSNRSAPPEDLIPQFDIITQLLESMGIKRLTVVGYEADDIIGSVINFFKNDFDKIFIATGDKDLMQFVGGNVFMLDTKLEKVYREKDVFEKMGVYPHQIVDYLSMVGDSSDNIPGMKGVGAKGASKLLEEFGSLDAIYKNRDALTNKRLKVAFENEFEQAILSRNLVKIVTDLKIPFKKDELEYRFNPSTELEKFLLDLGFKSLIKKLHEMERHSNDKGADDTNVCIGPILVDEKRERDSKTLDYETVSIKESTDFPELMDNVFYFFNRESKNGPSLAFWFGDGPIFVIRNNKNLQGLFFEKCIAKNYLKIVGHHLKDDFLIFINEMRSIQLSYFDLAQIHYILDVSAPHNLESLSKSILNIDLTSLVDDEEKFVCDRAYVVAKLFPILMEQMREKEMEKVYLQIDGPLIPILSEMEKNGIKLNPQLLQKVGLKLNEEIKTIEDKIHEISGDEINLRSPKQVSDLLFNRLGFPVIEKTKTMLSTNVEVLEELETRNLGPVPSLLLRYREIDKLLSTYVNVLPEMMNSRTGRIHTSFHQDITATGRLSSDRPNLQNIPIRSEEGRMVRMAFEASEGMVLLSADYSQVELRILAHFSQDEIMLNAFHRGLDIHTQTASEVLGIPLQSVTAENRNLAKTVNFGLIYGQSSFGLSRTLKISRSDAKNFISAYFEKFSKIKGCLDDLKEKCAKEGYSKTLFGRKRYLPDIHSKNHLVRSNAERMAINTPIQGTAADIIKIAMVNIYREMGLRGLKSKILLQVHDELIFEVPLDELQIMEEIVRHGMESAVNLTVPLRVEMKNGANWYLLK